MLKAAMVLLCVFSICTGNPSYRCTGECPNGASVYNCIVPPCQYAECGAHPEAECCDDYCGGCNAYFYFPKKNGGRQWVNC